MRCSPSQKNPRVAVIIAALLVFGGIAYAIPIFCNAGGIAIGGAIFQLVTVAAVAQAQKKSAAIKRSAALRREFFNWLG